MNSDSNASPQAAGLTNQDARIAAHQAVRIRRLLMSLGSYGCTVMVALVCCVAGLVQPFNVALYAGFAVLITGFFAALFYSGLNLRWHDPNMTMEQMIVALMPTAHLMYWVESPLARGAFLFMSIIPLLYGVMGLNTRRMIVVGLIDLGTYIGLMGLILMYRPQNIDAKGDWVIFAAFIGTLIQMALIGGYIFGLRDRLTQKTMALNEALVTISDMANRDELTGVFNRRVLMRFIDHEVARCMTGVPPFCVALIDLDHFKQINDQHGHSVGDEVLKVVAQAIRHDVRQMDCFGRYGGEEFLLVLPQTSLTNAQLKIERLRSEIAKLRYDGLPADRAVTISCGVAEFRLNESVAQLIARADKALYQAKETGRNKVVCAPELPTQVHV